MIPDQIESQFVSVALTIGSTLGLFLLRRVAKSLAELVDEFQNVRDLPDKVEKAIERIETKFDQRMSQNEAKIETILGVIANDRRN